MSLLAEAVFWETGAWPRSAPSPIQIKSASGIVDRVQSRIRRWAKARTPKPFEFVPPPPADKLEDQIVEKVGEPLVVGALESLEVDDGADYAEAVRVARETCNHAWPRYATDDLVPTIAPLSPDDLAEVWSIAMLMRSPDRVLDEFDAWTLTSEQAISFREVLPEISALIDDAIGSELVDAVARRKPITWQQEDVLRTWKGAPPETPIIASKPTTPPPPPSAPPAQPKTPIDATQDEAAARRRQR